MPVICRCLASRPKRLQSGVLNACFSLAQFPRRCSLAPEAEAFRQEVRLLLYRNRKAVYRIL